MKKRHNLITIGLLSGLLGLLGISNTTKGQTNSTKPKFEMELETFTQLGFTLNSGVNISDILEMYEDQAEFEEQPYSLLYQILGLTIEREPWTPITNKCWNFDLEAIEDNGGYVDIMTNIARITNGDLLFENLQDYVNIDEGKAWVSFTCKGDRYKWDLRVDNDWADGDLFDKVQALAEKYKTNGRFTFFNTGGQDFVLGYCSPEEHQRLRQATGLEIVWLKAKGQIY